MHWHGSHLNGCKAVSSSWWVYILRCSDQSLYAGVTKDPARRLEEHNSSPKGAKYTKSRRPVTMILRVPLPFKEDAYQAEYQIKKMNKNRKEAIIAQGASHPFFDQWK